MSTYLITGATGFVGKRLINSLMSDGHKVIPVSRESIPNLETVICDFESSNLSKVHLRGVDIVFHLAIPSLPKVLKVQGWSRYLL